MNYKILQSTSESRAKEYIYIFLMVPAPLQNSKFYLDAGIPIEFDLKCRRIATVQIIHRDWQRKS